MPANGKDHITAYCIRGVRKVTPQAWADYDAACNPDIIVALSDTPFTPVPASQKRMTKSVERSLVWLADLLRSRAVCRKEAASDAELVEDSLSNVLVHMAGGALVQARKAFSDGLMEDFEGRDADQLRPYRRLDDGVAGYIFDLVPLRAALSTRPNTARDQDAGGALPRGAINTLVPTHSADTSPLDPVTLSELFQASLLPLPIHKPRIVNSARSPHEMLRLIRDAGVDLFDAHWAQRAADIGVALDFRFPIVPGLIEPVGSEDAGCTGPKIRPSGKADLGHNLYSAEYAEAHSRLAASFLDGRSDSQRSTRLEGAPDLRPACPCGACSPRNPDAHILHSALDDLSWGRDSEGVADNVELPFMRSYVHHLLHTHEMSAHSLLVMHNLSVLDAFFAGVRSVLEHGESEDFGGHVGCFLEAYDEDMVVFDEAKVDWAKVEMARGKGRLAREKVKQAESSLGTTVDT